MPSSRPHAAAPRPDSGPGAIPLWRQLDAVADALMAVRNGQSGTAAVAAVEPALRAGVQALLFTVLRQLGRAEALRAQLAPRRPKPRVDALLCTALALGWQSGHASYEPFTLVNQAVEAAKRHAATRGQAAFVNACLRRFLRERDALVAATDADPVARWNHPVWWIDRVRQDHPDHWQQILQANNSHAPMALRINRQKVTGVAYNTELFATNLIAKQVSEVGLVLESPQPVQRLPGFLEGWVSVQDPAAQRAAPLLLDGLDLAQPLRVLDACAAPGGKTAHLLEHAGAASPIRVTALEIDPVRSARIGETLQRLGLSAQVLVADAGRPQDWWQDASGGEPFDAILLDAPCTASGIVRRHPDVRWLRRPTDIAQLAAQQARLLSTLWPLLKPGGRLLYCTCSVFRAEGDGQVQAFLASNNDAHLLPSPGHLLPGDPGDGGGGSENPSGDHDGFFYALLGKRPL
ncbi:16S rRNA (cytosine(967)-C(5))-methyltransferase RsmB [Acidovorax sp. NCPPB 4044]|uniref:16S rRNA (cytosine(967)-C(5))-methyltransferase RsmB n=1 Tax=Acidovorax sp. NCPPB 4044 TaxID=2940490 RepID=UPI0023036201|nr:16S rRNA (cytosine(967)-C(5))-methyltransferase RsmB [Acidovorax sp. NCPPB 4044]MDA8523638.1 16S rRNA (cytosine(967)-C(5))-methyltransferase RsmB [Acidovorax sp. NCPPB 4044]